MVARKLATIRKISDLLPIPNADQIEVASLDGWRVCVRKDTGHKVGELVLYLEVDSFIPLADKRFNWLADSGIYKNIDGKEGYRVITKRMRGQISQGIVQPLSYFPEIVNPVENMDVTSLLGITQFEKEGAEYLKTSGALPFPSVIPKTDQERIQNMQFLLKDEQYRVIAYEMTEKIDGSSMTVYKMGDRIGFCSRKWDITADKDAAATFYGRIFQKYNFPELLKDLKYDVAIQGEIVGPKVNGNNLKLSELEFYVFDIWDLEKNRYMFTDERLAFAQLYNLKHVPLINSSYMIPSFFEANHLIELTNRFSLVNPKVKIEGIVFKQQTHLEISVNGGLIHFKVLNPDYLLKHGD